MTYEEAEKLLHEWITSESLLNHCRSVETIMAMGAKRYGLSNEEIEKWKIVGLLHDADYEKWPLEHPNKIADYLANLGEKELAKAILSHSKKTGIIPETLLEKFLFASDELSGFITACSLVRPDRLETLNFQSVKKKLKDKSFAAKVNRDEIYEGVKLLNIELKDHVEFLITCLKTINS